MLSSFPVSPVSGVCHVVAYLESLIIASTGIRCLETLALVSISSATRRKQNKQRWDGSSAGISTCCSLHPQSEPQSCGKPTG